MTPAEAIQKQLDDPKSGFVKVRSDVFCKLAEKVKPKEDSEDDVEVSMARTLRLHNDRHVETLNVNRKVAERLVPKAETTKEKDAPKKDASK